MLPIATGALILIAARLTDIWKLVRQIPRTTEPEWRDRYVVVVFTMTHDGRDLVQNRDGHISIDRARLRAFEKTDDDTNTIWWVKDAEKSVAAEERVAFDDYEPAVRYAEDRSQGWLGQNLAREVVLWAVAARSRPDALSVYVNHAGAEATRRLMGFPVVFAKDLINPHPRATKTGSAPTTP